MTAVPSRDILSNSIVNLVSQPRSRRRVNVAVTEGHEEDVGTKTSFYCAAFRSLSNSLMSGRPFGFKAPPYQKVGYHSVPKLTRH